MGDSSGSSEDQNAYKNADSRGDTSGGKEGSVWELD
jgi:hypothetical protein